MKFCDQKCMGLWFTTHPTRKKTLTSPRWIAEAAGLKRYSTGEPCIHGHVSERWVLTGCCIACIASKAHLYPHRSYENNPEKIKARVKQWRKDNPGKKRGYDMTREAKMRGEDCYTLADAIAQWKKQDHKCAVPNCTQPISDIVGDKAKYQVDHIFPLAKDGSPGKINIQCLCPYHNISKRAKDPFEWARKHLKLSSEDYELLTSGWLAAYEHYIKMNPHRKKKHAIQGAFAFK